MLQRLQKILSAHGVSSRRAAEALLAAGRVTVNGRAAAVGQSADPDTDIVAVDGVPLETKPDKVYIMLNKPRGYVTTMKDDKGRKNVAELTAGCPARVWPVGRLDIDSEGLLIMTNDGELTNRLTHPSGGKTKTYQVTVRGGAEKALDQLRVPMLIDGYETRPARVRLLKKTPEGGVLEFVISEGRNRQIRKMCAQAGLAVTALKRVAEGGLALGRLEPGRWRYLTDREIGILKCKNAGNGH